MDLSERKKAILSAIIKSYILNGSPIGSKALCEMLDMNVSTATLRNEMNSLCEMGYLAQPHTSAGRIPTDKGYKMYVTDLMEHKSVKESVKETIDEKLQTASKYPEQLLSIAGDILADLTGFPTIVIKTAKQERYIRRVEFMPTGKKTVMLVVITSDGIVKSKLCRTNEILVDEMLGSFDKLVASRVIGTDLRLFNKVLLQSLVADLGLYALPLLPLLTAIFEMANEISSSTVSLQGESNILSCFNTELQAKAFLDFVSKKQEILNGLQAAKSSVEVVFGGDTGIEELFPSNMVLAQFKLGQSDAGRIGIIGPNRIDYENIMPNIQYFADKLSELITETMSDMEEN